LEEYFHPKPYVFNDAEIEDVRKFANMCSNSSKIIPSGVKNILGIK